VKTVLQALHQYFPFFNSLQTGHFSIAYLLKRNEQKPAQFLPSRLFVESGLKQGNHDCSPNVNASQLDCQLQEKGPF
jgi:hypothetical protein